jgi:hypothetical protein
MQIFAALQMIEGGTGDFIVCSGKRTDGSPIVPS